MRPSEIRGTKQNSNEESNMIILGLTGSIGTGKSTASRYLQKRGIPVLDADQMVKNLYTDKKTITETWHDNRIQNVIDNDGNHQQDSQ